MSAAEGEHAHCPAAAEPGSGIRGADGVPSWPASHGSELANAWVANGQSCLPGVATTAQSMPCSLPSAHSELAAAVWSPGFPPPSRPPRPTALASAVRRANWVGGLLEMANQPDMPRYWPC